MQSELTMAPAKASWVRAGQIPRKSTTGMAAKEGRGFHTNPMAARWGSRLPTTYQAWATRDSASPTMDARPRMR
jgi:hypothetical protein